MTSRSFSVSIPAEKRSLKCLRAFLRAVLDDVGCDKAEDLVLAVDEACSNVIKYRCRTIDDGQICVTAEFEPAALRVRVGRFCMTQDVGRIKPRELDDVRPGGLGTSFISRIMDRVEFEEEPGQPGCVALVLERALRTASEA